MDFWVIFGFIGQSLFFMRFVVQWLVSEKKGESVIPNAFWYFSIVGSVVVLSYAIHKLDPVFILGQSVASLVYVRNIMLIYKKKRATVA